MHGLALGIALIASVITGYVICLIVKAPDDCDDDYQDRAG